MALDLARPNERPYAVGLAIAAYSLPGALVGLAAASRLADLQPRVLLTADAILFTPSGTSSDERGRPARVAPMRAALGLRPQL